MARNKRASSRNSGSVNPSAGGFVPASTQHRTRSGSLVTNSMDFDSGRQASHSQAADRADLGSAGQYSRNSANYTHRRTGMSRGKKVAIAVVIIALLAALSGLGFYVFKEMQKNAINEGLHDLDQEEMEAVDNELTGMTKFDEPFTMLLLGSDARSGDPDMGARTDTIILVRIDPVTNKVAMVSIPRDTMIDIDGVGTQKFNAAYTYGGPSGTIAAVKQLCGVDIDHYAEINFEGLVGLVDAIGGIDVMVDETIDDPDAGDIVIPAGQQHLDGAATLVFSRSRAYADGDYTRVSNQRKVIEAIVHKGLEAPATELYGIVRASTGFMTTDTAIKVDFIYSLADQMRHNNDNPFTLYSATLPSGTGSVDGVSYVIADKAGVAELMQVFMACGDVSQPLASSSLENDRSAAGTNGGNNANAQSQETYYYYEEPTYYVETEEVYVDAGAANAGGAGDAGGAVDAGYADGGADAGAADTGGAGV